MRIHVAFIKRKHCVQFLRERAHFFYFFLFTCHQIQLAPMRQPRRELIRAPQLRMRQPTCHRGNPAFPLARLGSVSYTIGLFVSSCCTGKKYCTRAHISVLSEIKLSLRVKCKFSKLSQLFGHLNDTYHMFKMIYNPDVKIYDILIHCENY